MSMLEVTMLRVLERPTRREPPFAHYPSKAATDEIRKQKTDILKQL